MFQHIRTTRCALINPITGKARTLLNYKVKGLENIKHIAKELSKLNIK